MRLAPIWDWSRTRRYDEPSSHLGLSPSRQFCPDCITATRGYDFREGQADKFGAFLPKDRGKRTEALNWLFWQMGSTPYVGGGFGHFYAYAPVKIKYAIDRFTMEVKRLLDVLDQRLADNRFIAGDEYTIADMAIWPWYGNGMLNGASYNDPRKFLQTHEYKNLTRWTKEIGERPAVKRGRMVNRASGPPEEQLRERHDASDFATKTQDKIDARG